jgi:hypothetical protein
MVLLDPLDQLDQPEVVLTAKIASVNVKMNV